MQVIRLRQVVVAAADLAATTAAVQSAFGLGAAYADPGVAEFGLANAVLPIGDQFLEVVSPTTGKTAAGRWMDRAGGDAGYMVIFQVASIYAARHHLTTNGFRTVWSGDLHEISGTHVHPADIGGAIVSFDEARPEPSWHWAGPQWRSNVQTSIVRGIAGITMAATDPDKLAESWSRTLHLSLSPDRTLVLPDGSAIAFTATEDDVAAGRSGLVAIDLIGAAGSGGAATQVIAGTTFTISD